jgi:hypothetical protein
MAGGTCYNLVDAWTVNNNRSRNDRNKILLILWFWSCLPEKGKSKTLAECEEFI